MEKRILNKLQNTELEILKEFVSICEKHNLEYFLVGGTLLGAVRHQGFIPWDDDIDVGMPRKDYNKFIKICKKELNSRFFLDCHETNKYCYNPFIKLKLNNTIFLEDKQKNLKMHHGIWIDIFPYDNANNKSGFVEKFKKKMVLYTHSICRIKNKTLQIEMSKLKFGIFKFISLFFTNKFLNLMLHKLLQLNTNNNSKYICSYCSTYSLEKEIFEKEIFFPTVDLVFEGKKYKCPKNYDSKLKQVYNDYMKLPPKEKRITHSPQMIKFEDGEEYICPKQNK